MDKVSPKYMVNLIAKVKETMWHEFSSYENVLFYIKRWHETYDSWNENFRILYQDSASTRIDLLSTLHEMDEEILLKIAIDLGIETPDFLPSVPTFRNEVKANYETASSTFEKAYKLIETDPDTAVGLVNSALESIVKKILSDDRITIKWNDNDTLYNLVKVLLKEFSLYPTAEMPDELKSIGSALLTISQNVEKIRSTKTCFHGKKSGDYIISDSLYVYFVINSVTTIGLFLMSYYEKHYPRESPMQAIDANEDDCNLPF